MKKITRAISLIGAMVGLLSAGCDSVPEDDRFVIRRPDYAEFASVSPFLVHRCGSLDCHGQPDRNLRLYGKEGLRLDPKGIPGSDPTSASELEQNYRSVVALEPEIMSQVVRDHGASADMLTLLAKPRGEEEHKGGQLWIAGDEQDLCVTSWLSGSVDKADCTDALKSVP